MTFLGDTSAEADRVLSEVYRRMPLEKKWRQLGEAFETARLLHAAGCRLRDPEASAADIHSSWLRVQYDSTTPVVGLPTETMSNLPVLRHVLAVFDQLGIAYALGGSMASSIHGVPRFTRAADVNVLAFPGKEESLPGLLGPDYYVSAPAVQQAVRDRSSFNIINTREGFKIVVFVCQDGGFHDSVMRRRQAISLPDAPDRALSVQTPEDVVLFKLHWFRLGQESSEQQWKDILGVLKSKSGQLDDTYLNHWAAQLKVDDLLARAHAEITVTS
jgi:hypothetical protein